MKATNIKIVYLFIFLITASNPAFSQWENGQISVNFSITEIALVDIEPDFNNSIQFVIRPTAEKGQQLEIMDSSNESLWINYSSALSNTHQSRSIIAEISQGTLPNGLELFVEASNYSGLGKGKLGLSVGKTSLTNRPKPIITNIGSCFTGDGINNGHLLTFSIEIKDYEKIRSGEETIFTVLYTIKDN